ncbi:MAG: hypothetical protein ISR96_09335 [Nitrospira sp.]|nr:hypothetical protein [Nitrospira sp.]
MSSIIDISDFFDRSMHLNYQLSADPIEWNAVLSLMHTNDLSAADELIIIDTLKYLGEAYSEKRRHLGPFAVLHPIRATALFSLSGSETSIMDLLTILLHDKDEDILEGNYPPDKWVWLQSAYAKLMDQIDEQSNWLLNERIQFLARETHESYLEYLTAIITRATATPQLIRIKLADRLDNTLDLRMDLYEDRSGEDFYQYIFKMLFADATLGSKSYHLKHVDRKINGAKRLYELYKSAIFLSLLNSEKVTFDEGTQNLYNSVATASINEANNIMLHIVTYHMTDIGKQKKLLLDVMDYCQRGGLQKISTQTNYLLDGLFRNYFYSESRDQIKINLVKLYADKELMAVAAVAFSAIFTNFINSRSFSIGGI